jgi:galactokinase
VAVVEESASPLRRVEILMADPDGQPKLRVGVDDLEAWRNPEPPPQPLDYARGAIAATLARGGELRVPARIAVAGDVPIGFGLSSSAALCVALCLALNRRQPRFRDLVLMAQEAEHRAGTPCGTLDQSTSIAGGVVRYDGATLTTERLDPDLGDNVFAVADSGVARALGASSYPVRVEESRQALELVRQLVDPSLANLAALGLDGYNRLLAAGSGVVPEVLLRRVRHVVTEVARVEQGIAAMRAGDWATFGALMTASGRSSAADYEISHPPVEELVAEALALDGVLGARMMGGGEGGSVLILLPRSRVEALIRQLYDGYYTRYGLAGRAHLVHLFGFDTGAALETLG